MGAVVVGIAGAAPFVDGDRVALWGDSITHAGLYPKMLADFYLTRYPDRTVRFYNAGVAGDNAGAAMSRFEEDVKRWNPTVVTLMFGMNDSGRTMYDPRWMANPSYRAGIPAREKKCYETYSANMVKLVARLRADLPKARRMFLTPTPYDETAVQKDVHLAPALKGTVATLKRYADCGKKLAAETGGEVVDWNTAYQDLVVREQRKNPAFSFVRPDRVHPAAPGHLFMTYVFLKTQGVSGIVSDVALSAKSGTVQKSDNATVSDFTKTADGCAFTLLERALPWPIESAAKPALALAPILEDLNREVVAVKDLVPGARYTLFIDGTDVGTWTADELALGVNLANNAKTPQARQAAEVERKNAARCAIECDQLRMFAASRWYLRLRKVNPDDFAAVKAHYDGLKYKNGYFECKLPAYLRDYAKREAIERDQDTRWAELLALRTPKAHRYEVKRVAAERPAHGRTAGLAPKIEIDFTRPTGPINKWLHCAGYCSRSYPRGLENDDADLKPLHLTAARTHDWALVNSGQRLVDTQYIFPLLHLDPSDPKNYIFEPTDRVLSLTQNIGMKIFYRLGTSIEHTADWGFNTLNPTNHAQYAEALAGIVRHYTQGWANGFTWDIQNWEIYNEPNIVPCWRGTKAEFIDLFVTCLKRLKREFPALNFGGPAFAGCPLDYMKELLLACRAAGVEPDFVSWHYYGQDPDDLVSQPARVRRFLDGLGFKKCKLVIDEWHYIVSWDGIHGASSPDRIRQAHAGPSAHNGIDSGVFNLAVLSGFQNSCLDQSYFYGSGAKGSWGWKNGYGEYNKSYYSLKIFGDIVMDFTQKVAATAGSETTVSAFAGLSADGKKAFVLVADYRGRFPLVAHVKGLDNARVEKAIVLDHTRNNEPVEVTWRNGTLTLPRKDRNSVAFYVVFARP